MAQRYKIQCNEKSVEIDLVFKKNQYWLLVEVKYLDSPWRAAERVSRKQIQRLRQVNQHLSFNKQMKTIIILIALVEKNKKIHWINLIDY